MCVCARVRGGVRIGLDRFGLEGLPDFCFLIMLHSHHCNGSSIRLAVLLTSEMFHELYSGGEEKSRSRVGVAWCGVITKYD